MILLDMGGYVLHIPTSQKTGTGKFAAVETMVRKKKAKK